MCANVKKSYGVLCCRPSKNGVEVLMVKRSTTYHFCEFVSGRYRKQDNDLLNKLFNNMTHTEKIDILSLKFQNMWYRIYMENHDKIYFGNIQGQNTGPSTTNNGSNTPNNGSNTPNNRSSTGSNNGSSTANTISNSAHDTTYNKNLILSSYIKKKNKFESSFLQDSGKKLHTLIASSTNVETPWEFPKGRKNKTEEYDLDAAIREFQEETNVNKDQYNILYHIKPYVETYTDFDVTYQNIYYYAYATSDWEPVYSFSNKQQVSEISCIKWINLNSLIHMNLEKTTLIRLIKLFKCVVARFKNLACNNKEKIIEHCNRIKDLV